MKLKGVFFFFCFTFSFSSEICMYLYRYFALRKWKLQKYFLFHLPGFSFFPTSFSWIHSFPGSESNTKGKSLSDVEAGDIWFSRSSCSICTETSEPKIIRINKQYMSLPAFWRISFPDFDLSQFGQAVHWDLLKMLKENSAFYR